jgi:hypothetical protein
MQLFGLKYDAQAISDYHELHQYLVKHRKYTVEMMEMMFVNGHFHRYIEDGMSEEDIYQGFVDKCLSYGIIPLYSDSDGKYKLVDMQSFFSIIESRLRASGSELVSKMKNIKTVSNVLPKKTEFEVSLMRDDPRFDMLQSAKKKIGVLLPERKTEDEME